MNRRTFLNIAGGTIVLSQFMGCIDVRPFYRRLKAKLSASKRLPSDRPTASLPPEGASISVEKALNSRCAADFDGDPEVNHWGMVDTSRSLTKDHIARIVEAARPGRFADIGAGISVDRNVLTFHIPTDANAATREKAMIANGMLQQSVGLVCAALGVCVVFKNMGEDGARVSETEFGTLRYQLEPMKPSYGGAFWTSSPPTQERGWLTGNLPDPQRNGVKPLLPAIESAAAGRKGSLDRVTRAQLGQVLWAARGRTPHLYQSKPWGMTVPTAYGVQDRTEMLVVTESQSSAYVNWRAGRPTHALDAVAAADRRLYDVLRKTLPDRNCFILLRTRNETAMALWEIGSMAQNMILQALAMDISIESLPSASFDRNAAVFGTAKMLLATTVIEKI